ncbi:MAG TPA: hypothetical protein VGE43_07875 [Acidimicrobiales bacterium]
MPVVVVAGASWGIGRATSVHLTAAGRAGDPGTDDQQAAGV